MLRRSAAKAVQELIQLRAGTQHVPQGAGEQLQALHRMVQHQTATPDKIDQGDSAMEQSNQAILRGIAAEPALQQQPRQHLPHVEQQQQPGPQLQQQDRACGVQQQRSRARSAKQKRAQTAQQLHEHYLQSQLSQQSQRPVDVKQRYRQIASGQPAVGGLGQQLDSSTTTVTSASGIGSELTPAEEAGGLQRATHPEDAFQVHSLQQQYQLTLDSLHIGQSKNIAQLAQVLDPHAVLAAPDKGAAILEALMFGAAKLRDMQLLAQLLRCCEAAQIPLSAAGHTAVLHGLAHSGQANRAKRWLQEQVPQQLLSTRMLRAVVQPLLQQGHVQIADELLQWASARSQFASTAAGSIADDVGSVSSAAGGEVDDIDALVIEDKLQELPCLRLMVAGARRDVAVVQAEWAAIQQEQQAVAQQQQSNSSYKPPLHHPHLLGVSTWASYLSALCKASKSWSNRSIAPLLRHAVHGLADVYHATAWNRWARYTESKAFSQQGRQQSSPPAGGVAHQQLQQQAQQLWQQLRRQDPSSPSWQQLDPSAVLPQEVSSITSAVEKRNSSTALFAALHVAADDLDRKWMDELLKTAAMLKIMPNSYGFDAIFNIKLHSGQTPEALEELLGELMGWGVSPTLAHYEHLAEAYALHGRHESAVDILDRVYAAGQIPLLRTYNRLLHGLATQGRVLEVGKVYLRLKMQGLTPDEQTLRALFKCVRMYANRVRVVSARKLAELKPGDRKSITSALSHRSALFAGAYSQLAEWQGELVNAGLKHTDVSMYQLLGALERLGAVDDCVQLAKLHEEMKPGTYTAHRFALKAASRIRTVQAASQSAQLADRLRAGDKLSKRDYTLLISTQFWLHRDHQQLLQTVAAMRAAGYELDQNVLLQVLHVYCHHDMWGEALRVLDDVSAGRVGISSSLLGGPDASQGQGQRNKWPGSSTDISAADEWPRTYPQPAEKTVRTDPLWHVVMRKLWEKRAGDSLLNEFLQRMSPEQLLRFKVLYNLQLSPEGGYTMQPLAEWQLPPETTQPVADKVAEHTERLGADASKQSITASEACQLPNQIEH